MKRVTTAILLALLHLALGCSESADGEQDTFFLYTKKRVVARIRLPEGESELITVPGSGKMKLGLFVAEHAELIDRNKSANAPLVAQLKQEGTRFFVSTYYAASNEFDLAAGNLFSLRNDTGMIVNVVVYQD